MGAEICESCRKIALQNDDPFPASWALMLNGYCRFMAGQNIEADRCLTNGVHSFEATGVPIFLSWIYSLQSEVLALQDRIDEAIKVAEKALNLRDQGDVFGDLWANRALSLANSRSKHPDWVRAEKYCQEAITIATERGMRPQQAITNFRYTEILHKKGDLDAAREQLHRATGLFSDMEMTWWTVQAQGLRWRIDRGEAFKWFAPYVDGPPN